jgi:hypothetical protein
MLQSSQGSEPPRKPGRFNPLLSLPFVLGVNTLQVLAFAYFLLWAPDLSIKTFTGFLLPLGSPAVTIYFVLARPRSGVVLHWIVALTNLLWLLVGLVVVFYLSRHLSLSPGEFFAAGCFGVLIPVINILSVVARWPESRAQPQQST